MDIFVKTISGRYHTKKVEKLKYIIISNQKIVIQISFVLQ